MSSLVLDPLENTTEKLKKNRLGEAPASFQRSPVGFQGRRVGKGMRGKGGREMNLDGFHRRSIWDGLVSGRFSGEPGKTVVL